MRKFINLITEATSDIEAELEALMREAKELGVFLSVYADGLSAGRSGIGLMEIGRDGFMRGDDSNKGRGAIVMQKLIDIADRHGLSIHLAAEGREPKLIDYYKRFGFVHDVEQDDPEEYGSTPMIRPAASK